MSLTAKFQITNPDNVEATMTITMDISSWKKVRDAVAKMDGYPSFDLALTIRRLIDSAEKQFYHREGEEER